MYNATNDISIERLLEQDIPELVGYHRDIVMINTLSDIRLFSHPARMKATTVLVCLRGEIDCSVNLQRFRIKANHLLVNFASDVIQIHSVNDLDGYAIMISEDYLQKLQLDFRMRVQSYIGLRRNGPLKVPYDELVDLKPYYTLLKKNMESGNPEVIKGLALALSHTILYMMMRTRNQGLNDTERETSREQQIFDRFMTLLKDYHQSERSLKFYADKMHLTPKYVSGMIKNYSGKAALEWINEYVTLEARMMLRYSRKSVQEVAYALNFPTQSAFGKYFRQQTGMSPRRYRESE